MSYLFRLHRSGLQEDGFENGDEFFKLMGKGML
jgi:hypothetical protein